MGLFSAALAVGARSQAMVYVEVCDDGVIQTITEAEAIRRHGHFIGSGGGPTYIDVLQTVFKNVSRLNPSRVQLFTGYLASFSTDFEFVSGVNLPAAGDPEQVDASVRAICKVQTLFFARPKPLSSEKRFVVNQDLWTKLTPISQASAVLESFLLKESWLHSNHSTPQSRHLNSYLLTDFPLSDSLQTYVGKLQVLNLRKFDYLGFEVELLRAPTWITPNTLAPGGLSSWIAQSRPYVWSGKNYVLKAYQRVDGFCRKDELMEAVFEDNQNEMDFDFGILSGRVKGVLNFKTDVDCTLKEIGGRELRISRFPDLALSGTVGMKYLRIFEASGQVDFLGSRTTSTREITIDEKTGKIVSVDGEFLALSLLDYTGSCDGRVSKGSLSCQKASGQVIVRGTSIPVTKSMLLYEKGWIEIDGKSYYR